MSQDQEWWSVPEAAAHCGITRSSWRSYVATGYAPPPDDPDAGSVPQRRRPRWRPETVRAWKAARPGRTGRPRSTSRSMPTGGGR